MYHGKQPRSWNNYQKNIIKCLDIFLQDMRNWNMEKMIIKLM